MKRSEGQRSLDELKSAGEKNKERNRLIYEVSGKGQTDKDEKGLGGEKDQSPDQVEKWKHERK